MHNLSYTGAVKFMKPQKIIFGLLKQMLSLHLVILQKGERYTIILLNKT